jgi:hypothetical protein
VSDSKKTRDRIAREAAAKKAAEARDAAVRAEQARLAAERAKKR